MTDYRYRFKLKGPFADPHWLTTVRRWDDGSIKEANHSNVTNNPWSCRHMETADAMKTKLDAHYEVLGLDNPFILVDTEEFRTEPAAPELGGWRHESGYAVAVVCRNCTHCLVQESYRWPAANRYYCMRTWPGSHRDAFTLPSGSAEYIEAWEHLEVHTVDPSAKCRYVRVEV